MGEKPTEADEASRQLDKSSPELMKSKGEKEQESQRAGYDIKTNKRELDSKHFPGGGAGIAVSDPGAPSPKT